MEAMSEREMLKLAKMNADELRAEIIALKGSLHKANGLVEFLTDKYKQILEQYELLRRKYASIDSAPYNPKLSWVTKIVYVLKKMDRPLTSSEIIELISPYEPLLMHSRHPAQAFSANLNKAVKHKRVLAYKLGGTRGFYYVLPEWMDQSGSLVKEYEDKIFLK